MTSLHARRTTGDHGNRGEESLPSILQQGQDNVQRLSLHTCLLERRLRGGADPTDLLLLVQDIKSAVEELHALFRSALQVVQPASVDAQGIVKATAAAESSHVEAVDLCSLLARCVASVRQRVQRKESPLLCDIAPDLPSVTTNPEALAQAFSLLLDAVVRANGKGGLEVRVRHIFLPLSPGATAAEEQEVGKLVDDIRKRALAGEDFATLANIRKGREPGRAETWGILRKDR